MDYYDEWRTELLPEEELAIIYADWESEFSYFWFEYGNIPICFHCGNVLNSWSSPHFAADGQTWQRILFCGVH